MKKTYYVHGLSKDDAVGNLVEGKATLGLNEAVLNFELESSEYVRMRADSESIKFYKISVEVQDLDSSDLKSFDCQEDAR